MMSREGGVEENREANQKALERERQNTLKEKDPAKKTKTELPCSFKTTIFVQARLMMEVSDGLIYKTNSAAFICETSRRRPGDKATNPASL